MTDAPERIWKWRSRIKGGAWDAWENGRFGGPPPPFADVEEVPYILATPGALAASPEVQALIKEAQARGMERAGLLVQAYVKRGIGNGEIQGWNAASELEAAIRAEAATIREMKQ